MSIAVPCCLRRHQEKPQRRTSLKRNVTGLSVISGIAQSAPIFPFLFLNARFALADMHNQESVQMAK